MSGHASLLPDWVAHRATRNPDRTALVADGTCLSYRELDAEVDATARRLAALGVAAGDRVATCLHNGALAAILPHAVLRLGATLVPLNTRLATGELAWQLERAEARVLVVDRRSAHHFEKVDGHTTIVASDGEASLASGRPALADAPQADVPLIAAHSPDHVLAIIHTSGTTGTPRGAMLTVGNFWWSAIGSALNVGLREDDRWLAPLPLFHVGGLSIVLRSAIYGTAAEIHDGFDAARVNEALDSGKVSMISVVAVMLQRMMDERADRPYPPSLRFVLLGGGPAPETLLERCSRSGVPVALSYGLTETSSQVATLAPGEAVRRPGSAGRAIYPNELRIASLPGSGARRRAAGESESPPPGEEGEILVRGPVVMKGYFGQQSDTERVLEGGWLHTGDIGRIDPDGYLYVLDRRSDLIITGGENVYPAEVESALLAHENVAEAGVIGLPDAQWGQRVVAIVRLYSGGWSHDIAEAIRAHCRARLAGYKVPSQVIGTSEPLPRTASGKLRREELRSRFASGQG
jgi:O-succinylbenzoic acid--CoA ligase